jgi:hypothetical protein
MSDIGIKGLVTKSPAEIDKFVSTFIKSSLNIREGITKGKDPEICMLSLIRDTYMCNLILRYVGLMTIISSDIIWSTIDNRLIEYINDYYNNKKFKIKLNELYEHYLKTYEKKQINYDYCRFLDKMINRVEISKKGIEIKKHIRMMENRVFNILNINPVVKIASKYIDNISDNYEKTKHNKIIVPLTQANYHDMVDNIEDMSIRHQIQTQYMSRTQNALIDFSKLIVIRKELAEQAGYSTYFKYINRDKIDNSETIKEFISTLNDKIDKKTHRELERIVQYFIPSDRTTKISSSDVIKFMSRNCNNTKFDFKHVFNVLFQLLTRYFNLYLEKTNEIAWKENVVVYDVFDCIKSIDGSLKSTTNNINPTKGYIKGKLLGRLFLDTVYDENKKLINPISIRLSDKMQINVSNRTNAEIALLANYHNTPCMSYSDVVLLFREFGYIVSNMCYESRVGLINYDEEFSNYLPSLMEYIALDRDTIKMIIGNNTDLSVIDHIEHTRELDLCYNIKLKCINAKFDHLLHNSEQLYDMLVNAINQKNDASKEIFEIYKNIYKESMESVSDIFIDVVDYIDPISIVHEINGSQGTLYSNVMNEVFAYATFWIIKEKTRKDSLTNEFRESVLNNGVNNHRDLIRTFLKKIDINYFSLYIKNVIKTDAIDDYVTEDTNYFDEDDGMISDGDKEEIIQITRI